MSVEGPGRTFAREHRAGFPRASLAYVAAHLLNRSVSKENEERVFVLFSSGLSFVFDVDDRQRLRILIALCSTQETLETLGRQETSFMVMMRVYYVSRLASRVGSAMTNVAPSPSSLSTVSVPPCPCVTMS